VIDLAFFLIGRLRNSGPGQRGTQLASEWLVFVGSGVSTSGIPFSYHANWHGTRPVGHRVASPAATAFIFRPWRRYTSCAEGRRAIEPLPLDNDLDLKFKPGLMLQHATSSRASPADLHSG